jgi:putative membrane protein
VNKRINENETNIDSSIAVRALAERLHAVVPSYEMAVTESGSGSGSSGSRSSREAGADSSDAQMAAEDMQFMKDAAQSGMAEVKMGELASSNAESQPVKDLAQKLVTDHGKINEELKQLATRKNVMLPDAVTEQQKTMLQHLSSLKGTEFDSAFKQHAVENHQKSVDKFKTTSEKTKDMYIKRSRRERSPS